MKKTKRVIVFGIFDGVHEGHRDFFRQALRAASGRAKEKVELIVIVGRDSASLRLKQKKPRHSQETRLSLVSQEEGVEKAVLGDEEQSSYRVLKELNPDIICLGYDQDALWQDLQVWIAKKKKTIKLIRLKPYKAHLHHKTIP